MSVRLVCALSAICGLLLAFGCATNSDFASDPLLGGSPVPRSVTPAPAAPAKQTAVPPMQGPGASNSAAALANGAFQPLEPRPDLRTAGRGAGPTPAWKGPGTQPGVALQRPEFATDASPSSDFALTSAGRPVTYEQAQAALAAYGVTWQRLEAGPEAGEWKFACSIPNRQNPHIRRVHEARAREPVAAMHAVLAQMEKERQ